MDTICKILALKYLILTLYCDFQVITGMLK